jgi:hypothetical protein
MAEPSQAVHSTRFGEEIAIATLEKGSRRKKNRRSGGGSDGNAQGGLAIEEQRL